MLKIKDLVTLGVMGMLMIAPQVSHAAIEKGNTAQFDIQNVQADVDAGRTKQTFVIEGMNVIDTKVVAVDENQGTATVYRLRDTRDFNDLLTNELNCKVSDKPVNYTIVLENPAIAETCAYAVQNVTQTSKAKNKGPIFAMQLQRNRRANNALNSFLMQEGLDPNEAIFISLQGNKLVKRWHQQVLDGATKVNDFVMLPSTIKSSYNVLTNKSGW